MRSSLHELYCKIVCKIVNNKEWVLIHMTSFVHIHTIFAKSYVFYKLPIHMNLYEWPTANPAPKLTRHWGLDKSYKIVRVRSYEINRLVKYIYIRIAVR